MDSIVNWYMHLIYMIYISCLEVVRTECLHSVYGRVSRATLLHCFGAKSYTDWDTLIVNGT